MQSLIEAFPYLDIGYSDHTLTPVACLAAVAMGARVIERHFTYDKKADGPDHMLSADPEEMKWLVDAVRSFELMRGSGIKMPAGSEKVTRVNNRKSIVASCALKAGESLRADDIAVKRPGYGIQPRYLEQIVGRRLARDLDEDAVIHWSDLE
jgi:N,N'-diacetyllegionaminate synthase